MASKNLEVNRAVLDYANACKHPEDTERIALAHAALATARVADLIVRTLAETSLSADQRGRLARLASGEEQS